MNHQKKIRDWIQTAATLTGSASLAWRVAVAALKKPAHQLQSLTISNTDSELLAVALNRYLACEPLTRIGGSAVFYGQRFKVTPAVLDPRPETEMLVEQAIALRPKRILELGTGSGCIICSILKKINTEYALAVDISPDALVVAKENAQELGVLCEFRLSDWCEKVKEKFDLVVSNPPYVASTDLTEKAVWAYDPAIALYGGNDGMQAHFSALPQARQVLAPEGTILWEIGSDQSEAIYAYSQQIFHDAKSIKIQDDFNNLPRMLQISY